VTTPLRRLLPLLALALAALALAACGSGDGDASAGGSADSDEEQRLAFEDCLRGEGIDIRTTADGRVAIRASASRDESGSPSRTDRAFERCRRETGWAPKPPSEEQQQEMRDRALEFARCMREHGVDMPDPSSDGRMLMRVEEGQDAVVRRAQEECGELMGGAVAGTAPAAPAP
jgi:hypothetical protein